VVHASPTHLVWDVAGLFAVGLLFEESLGTRYFTVLLVSALTISFGLLLFDTSLVAYCGLSGVLNGLWVAGSLAAADRERKSGRTVLAWFYVACLGVLVLKLGVESVVGQGVLTDPASLGADPVPHAHVLGALGGLLAAAAFTRFSHDRVASSVPRSWAGNPNRC
jgi:rhomboid family GlyGly-CTERM serine protease